MSGHHVQHNAPKPQTGKLTPPAAPKAGAPAHHAAAPTPHKAKTDELSKHDALKRLNQAVDAHDAKLPWRNNSDMNDKLKTVIEQKLAKTKDHSAANVNNIVHSVINQNRGKLSYWNYDFKVNSAGKVMLSLDFKGKLNSFDSSGVTLGESVQKFLKKGGDPRMALAILKQVDDPDLRIKQLRPNTCVAADVQRTIAKMNPQKYFVFATQLMTKGHAELPHKKGEKGGVLTVSDENRKWIDAQNFDENKKINAYYQVGLMEYGNGKGKYDVKNDKSTDASGKLTFEGLNIEAAKTLAEHAADMPTFVPSEVKSHLKKDKKDPTPRNVYKALEDMSGSGKAHKDVLVAIKVGDPRAHVSHAVVIKGIDKDGVTVYDPAHDKTRHISADKFKNMIAMDITSKDLGGIGNWGGTTTTASSSGTWYSTTTFTTKPFGT